MDVNSEPLYLQEQSPLKKWGTKTYLYSSVIGSTNNFMHVHISACYGTC